MQSRAAARSTVILLGLRARPHKKRVHGAMRGRNVCVGHPGAEKDRPVKAFFAPQGQFEILGAVRRLKGLPFLVADGAVQLRQTIPR